MRRSVILLTILVAMVSVVLVGCGSQKDEDEIELDILVNQMQSGTWTPISSRFDVGSGWWDFENPGDGDFVFLVLVKEVAGDYLYRRYVGTYVIDKKRNPTGSFTFTAHATEVQIGYLFTDLFDSEMEWDETFSVPIKRSGDDLVINGNLYERTR